VFDQETGQDLSITDGTWIIRFGMFGWFGYIALFGLFAAAIFNARSGVTGPVTSSTILLGGLTLMLAVNLTDLIPNANLLPLTYVVAGSISARPRRKPRRSASLEKRAPQFAPA
jgi:MFS superfamily sulfate permease-like transporter